MDQDAATRVSSASIEVILERAEQTLTTVGERLLIERLHEVLDHEGSSGLIVLADTLLPHLQEVVATLPLILRDDADATAATAVRRLGVILQEHGYSLDEIVPIGITLYDRLLREVGLRLRDSDRAVVHAVGQINRALLRLGGDTLLAYCDRMTASLAQIAHTDSLTELANRRYFELRLGEELQRAQRTERPLTLILLDVDGLKRTNDDLGHAAGDDLLRAVAAVLRGQARGIDVAARIGGDEFALILPETGRDGAQALLDRLNHSAADQRVHDHLPSFSAGLAVYPDDGTTAEALMVHADAALYDDKRTAST